MTNLDPPSDDLRSQTGADTLLVGLTIRVYVRLTPRKGETAEALEQRAWNSIRVEASRPSAQVKDYELDFSMTL